MTDDRSTPRVHRGLSVFFEGNHVVGLRIWTLHARGAGRHTRNGETRNGGAFFEHFVYQVCRYVPFHNVPLYHGCVTPLQLARNPIFSLDWTKNLGVHYGD